MIFSTTWQQVLDGTKTQTRRLMKEGDRYSRVHRWVEQADGRLRWHIGSTYAVQPGRGKKAIGRIRITGIRRERLEDISEEDARAEGIDDCYWGGLFAPGIEGGYVTKRLAFFALWDSIHQRGNLHTDNPNVWVLEFELVSTT